MTIKQFSFFFLFSFLISAFAIDLLKAPIVSAGATPGWKLVRRYTFDYSTGINWSEWDEWYVGADQSYFVFPTVTPDNKLKLTVPDVSFEHPHCDYVCALLTRESFSPSLKLRVVANVGNIKVQGVWAAFWLWHDSMDIRNEATLELLGSWYVENGKPWGMYSVFANIPMTDKVYWNCTYRGNHEHFFIRPTYEQKRYIDYSQFGLNPYDGNYHTFDLDIGYADPYHKYVIGYVDGVRVYKWGLDDEFEATHVPTVPMHIWIDICSPPWEKVPNQEAYILIDRIEVYYWMSDFVNGNFESSLENWGYSNFVAGDFDNDGDKEVKPVDPFSGWWLIQDVCLSHVTASLTWKAFWDSAWPNGNVTFWLKIPQFCNLSLTLTFSRANLWRVIFTVYRVNEANSYISYITLPWDSWITFKIYRNGKTVGYQIGNNPTAAYDFLELDTIATISAIAVAGWNQKIMLDDFAIDTNPHLLENLFIKLQKLGNGDIIPNPGVYQVRNGTLYILESYPEPGYYTIWNIRDFSGSINYNVTSIDLVFNFTIDRLTFTAIFVNMTAANYTITPTNYHSDDVIYGYNVQLIKGTSTPAYGSYPYNVGNVTLNATAYTEYFFIRWIGKRYDDSIYYFPQGQNIINVQLNFTESGRPFWKSFQSMFSSCEVIININVPCSIYVITSAGEWIKVNAKQVASTQYAFYVPKGSYNLAFTAPGYYTKTVFLLANDLTEMCSITLTAISYVPPSGDGGAPCPRLIVGDSDLGFIDIHAFQDVTRNLKISSAMLFKAWNGTHVVLKFLEGSPEYSVSESDIDMILLNGQPPVKAILKGVDVTEMLTHSDDVKVHLSLNDELDVYFKLEHLNDALLTIEGVNMLKQCRVFVYEVFFNCSGSFTLFDGAIFVAAADVPAQLVLQIHYFTIYPIIDIYASNISLVKINVTALYRQIGGEYHYKFGVEQKRFTGVSIVTDSSMVLCLGLPMKPAELWKTTNSSQTFKITDYIWDGQFLTLTVSPGDPAYSIIYPSIIAQISQTGLEVVWQMLPFIVALALIVAAFSIFRRFMEMMG